ncbi:MAG: radical SAM family heme chaperone HemW [Granulosicoccaceae bacterium]
MIQQRHFTELPPLSLYVHLPWCVKKCPYCDFNSHEAKADIPEAAYIQAVLDDLTQELPDIWGRKLSSIFIGGGTPSLLSGDAIDTLMSGIRSLTNLAPNAEVTMEANPGTAEAEKFKAFRQSGINRLSIGVQSFDNTALKALGRLHDAEEAIQAVAMAKDAGFDDFNLDLMFALPEQTIDAAIKDVRQAMALQPTHISCYELTLEPNTLFARFPPSVPDHESKWGMQEAIIKELATRSYHRYEVSAYSKPKRESTHNSNYWQFGDYVGIGAGAHGKISFANTGTITRRWKVKHPKTYMEKANSAARIGGQHDISFDDTAIEFFMNTFRLTQGFTLPLFQAHTGVSLTTWQPVIEQAIENGLLQQEGLQLAPTKKGVNFLNDLLQMFLDDPAATKRYPIIPLIDGN